jgi:hypothetical protein
MFSPARLVRASEEAAAGNVGVHGGGQTRAYFAESGNSRREWKCESLVVVTGPTAKRATGQSSWQVASKDQRDLPPRTFVVFAYRSVTLRRRA